MNRIAGHLVAVVLGALLLCMAGLTHADARNPSERYTRVPADADGIGKRYMGRDIAGVVRQRPVSRAPAGEIFPRRPDRPGPARGLRPPQEHARRRNGPVACAEFGIAAGSGGVDGNFN